MNSFFSWLSEEHHITEPIVLKQIKAPLKPVTVFSDADVRAIVSFRPHGLYEYRTWVILQTLLDTGCRIDEILALIPPTFCSCCCREVLNGRGDEGRSTVAGYLSRLTRTPQGDLLGIAPT